MKKYLLLITLLSTTLPAFGLSSDRQQPIEIHSNKFMGDEVKQVAHYQGSVQLQQGSMTLQGDSLKIVVTPSGYRVGTLSGKLANLKQQRDPKPKTKHIEEWVYAEAKTIIYNEQKSTITLNKQAKISRLENGVEKDLTTGDLIVYDLITSKIIVDGGIVGGLPQRVSTIIAPKTTDNHVKQESASLSNATTLSNTENKKKDVARE